MTVTPLSKRSVLPRILAGILLASLSIVGCSGSGSEEISEEDVRSAVVKYLCSPRHAGPAFNRQVLGEIAFEIYNIDSNVLYFSMPERLCGNDSGRLAMARIVRNYDSVQWAEDRNGILTFADVRGRHTEERGCLFRTALSNIRVDTSLVLRFPFTDAEYVVSLKDLTEYFLDRRIYGGSRDVYRDDGQYGRHTLFINHGIFVGRPGEPSLARLVDKLTGTIPATGSNSRERKIQRLLDFVTTDIAYDHSEAAKSYEVLKRPCETLMSGRSDCSNKATLFASLLEQIGEDYLLVYAPEHISVAVPKGSFPEANGHYFDWQDQRWVICETTCEGFRIGADQLEKEFGFKQVEYVQRPREENAIINPHNGGTLAFR